MSVDIQVLHDGSNTHRWIKHSATDTIEEPDIDCHRGSESERDEEDAQHIRASVAVGWGRRVHDLDDGKCKEEEQECSCKFGHESSGVVSMHIGQEAHHSPRLGVPESR